MLLPEEGMRLLSNLPLLTALHRTAASYTRIVSYSVHGALRVEVMLNFRRPRRPCWITHAMILTEEFRDRSRSTRSGTGLYAPLLRIPESWS
jgi:hypothetical protein